MKRRDMAVAGRAREEICDVIHFEYHESIGKADFFVQMVTFKKVINVVTQMVKKLRKQKKEVANNYNEQFKVFLQDFNNKQYFANINQVKRLPEGVPESWGTLKTIYEGLMTELLKIRNRN